MTRSGEYTYCRQIGEAGRRHAVNKPFSDAETPRHFMDTGALFSLLPKPPARVLECGCGTGWLCRFLARKGYEVVGQDCCQDAIELARTHPLFVEEGNVTYVCSDFEDLGFRDEFDAVVFYAALHHSEAPRKAIGCAWQALKKGGVAIAIEPGLGHARQARETAERYDVGDRDMPAWLVVRLGRQAGFAETRVHLHPGQLISTLYGGEPHSRRLARVWRWRVVRFAFLLASLLVWKRFNGLVWMRK